jgi:alanine dehydrogenase
MPGAVPLTSTYALTNVTLPFTCKLAKKGIKALTEDKHLMNGLNAFKGKLTCAPVAEVHDLPYTPVSEIEELS